ncbi:MAG: FAD-dependent oxidoreductase [Rhodobacter sp.]|nr:FAD-dependent oxidoreductase [Rhodobacter sp.]
MALSFRWNGRPIKAQPGDSIAAALTAIGVHTFGTSRKARERGLFCGMGVCQDCLVIVDGKRSQRACMIEVREGMTVAPQSDTEAGDLEARFPASNPASTIVDLAIIGAGPAGLNAALLAKAGGAHVCIIDERHQTGGQYYKPRSEGYRSDTGADQQHRKGLALRQRVARVGVQIRTGETVWYARSSDDGSSFELRTNGSVGQTRFLSRAVIVATGAMERPAMIPGWTRPGVMTIGAAQTLVRRYGIAPGRRVLVAGHGPLGLQLAVELRKLGVDVAAVAERGRPQAGATLLQAAMASPGLVGAGLAYRLRLLRDRVPVLTGWETVEVLGEAAVKGARLRCIADGRTRDFAADSVCLGDGFAPQIELARLLGVKVTLDPEGQTPVPYRYADCATSVPGVWIAGDAGGLGGAQLAEAQGRLAAVSALQFLGLGAQSQLADLRQATKARRFQTALWRLYRAPRRAVPEEVVTLCRCEEVTAGQVRAAIENGATDPGAIKRATRLGMGRCQGRYCLPAALRMLEDAGHKAMPEALFAPQLPARPVPVHALSLEKPEWGGHVESSPGARPNRLQTRPLALTRADLVIIGAGVTGISAAFYAARAGARVICLDRGVANGEASGGNAGSLHLQLLSWDFGGKAVSSGSPQLQTLPLQQESIALWAALQSDLGADFEMKVTGGMMVAENEDHIAFLQDKVAAEARVGITSEVIGPERIRQLVPAIADRVVAAAWCAGEGKINPLIATTALAQAARSAGAMIEEMAPVTGLQRDTDGYEIATPRGVLRAPRVLIAAGGWSASIARLLGVDLPIRGAPLQMVVTETAPPMLPCLIAHADRHLTMKQTDAGTILIGGAWTAKTGQSGQPLVLTQSLEGNLWVAGHTVPGVANLSVIRSWAAMNIDIDGAPLIGPVPGLPGVSIAATANGYTLGPLMGREAAAQALSGNIRPDLAAFTMTRFT